MLQHFHLRYITYSRSLQTVSVKIQIVNTWASWARRSLSQLLNSAAVSQRQPQTIHNRISTAGSSKTSFIKQTAGWTWPVSCGLPSRDLDLGSLLPLNLSLISWLILVAFRGPLLCCVSGTLVHTLQAALGDVPWFKQAQYDVFCPSPGFD